MDYIYRVGWLVSFIIFSHDAGGANTLTRYTPFKITFEFVQKRGELFTETFWAPSARTARAMAHAGSGPGYILIHSVEEVIS